HHEKLGAVFAETGGWSMPVHYDDAVAEHAVVRRAVGVADLSHRGRILVTGDDRVKWLQSVISNDILPLTAGRGLYSSLLSHKGKMLSYFRVYLLADSVLLEDVGEIGDATFHVLRKFLLYGTKAKMENCTESWGLLLVSGPKAPDLLKSVFSVDVTDLKTLHIQNSVIAGQPTFLMRTEETGEFDLEIMIPVDGLIAAWDALTKAGEAFGLRPFGNQAREALRMEAGLPKAGPDLNEEIVPPEANLEGKAFSLSKGCYPGQEVVARMDTYGSVRRHLVGLVLEDNIIPTKGAKIFSGDREVGWISSAIHSPQLGRTIAFGFPLRDFSQINTPLAVEIDGARHDAIVHRLPFYNPSTT
ncbi:MAG: CAF17-like 4Fe-4S cluster assembly/insertion protein YgfZ, partial [Nitrospiraceae bacterium]